MLKLKLTFVIVITLFLLITPNSLFSEEASKSGDKAGGGDKKMVIKSIVFDQNTQAPVVLLTDEEGSTILPIWIGLCEARSIDIGVSDTVTPRPMTYDLIAAVLRTLGAKVERIVVVDIRDQVYYAQVEISVDGKISKIDARPSDAIALASRMNAPIYVKSSVLEKTGIPDPTKEKRGL